MATERDHTWLLGLLSAASQPRDDAPEAVRAWMAHYARDVGLLVRELEAAQRDRITLVDALRRVYWINDARYPLTVRTSRIAGAALAAVGNPEVGPPPPEEMG